LEAEMRVARDLQTAGQPGPLLAAGKASLPAKPGLLPNNLLLWLGFPLLLPGLMLNGLPALLSWWLTIKAVKRREFYASVLLAAGFFVFPLYWLGLCVGGFVSWGWMGLMGSLLAPLSAYPVGKWLDAYRLEKLKIAGQP